MAKPAGRSVTIHDVARQSGVSYQTVSRVINNHVSVADQTRARVLAAIEELNYRPSILAKSLVTKRSQLIGMVAYGTEQYGPSQVVQNVERSARVHGYEIILATLSAFKEQEIMAATSRLQQFGVDGLILLTPYDAHDIVKRLGTRLPFIMIDATADVDGTTVSIDQLEGGVIATEHLISCGHRQILHVSGPSEWSDSELRYRGYLQVLEANGLQALPRYEGDWSPGSGFGCVQGALQAGLEFTAVLAGNDQMALGAMKALKQAGLRVPEDVSVVGFDDTPETAYYDPPLTTVVQDFGLLGRKSLEELLRLIEQPQERFRHFVFQPQLVVRGTSGPAPDRA
ncbi:LacI family DNA-binding transcriptional regulator [Deinococcus altitudinis]|uniref:LacI family DNA-binding transcriptional regulator n=1 Tax=Deinococcus altitudinis TaxID=468914 RepID=UPI0038912C54